MGTKVLQVKQGSVRDVWGTPKRISYRTKPDKICELAIEDDNGNVIEAITSKTKRLRQLFRQYDMHYKEFDGLSQSKIDSTISTLLKEEKRMLFRIEGHGKDRPNTVFAVVTQKWKKVTIEKLIPNIKRAFREVAPGQKLMYDTKESTDKHGGSVEIWLPELKIIRPKIIITAGKLDGWCSLKIFGGCRVLSCSNELTAEVREELAPILGRTFMIRQVHAGENLYDDLREMISDAVKALGSFGGLIEKAKKRRLTEKQIKKILTYYYGHNMLSQKIIMKAMEQYKKEKTEGTLWGLCMALTYVGSNMDVKKTPKRRLGQVGGELLVVAAEYKKYEELVETYIDENELELIDLSKAEVVAEA